MKYITVVNAGSRLQVVTAPKRNTSNWKWVGRWERMQR